MNYAPLVLATYQPKCQKHSCPVGFANSLVVVSINKGYVPLEPVYALGFVASDDSGFELKSPGYYLVNFNIYYNPSSLTSGSITLTVSDGVQSVLRLTLEKNSDTSAFAFASTIYRTKTPSVIFLEASGPSNHLSLIFNAPTSISVEFISA